MKNNISLPKDFVNHAYYQDIKFRLVYFHILFCEGKVISLGKIAKNTNLKIFEVQKIISKLVDDKAIEKYFYSSKKVYYLIKRTEVKDNNFKEKGTRINKNLSLSKEWKVEAVNIGVSNPELVFSEFKDYWIARSGKGAIKLDWLATWRYWCRKSIQFANSHKKEDDIPEEYIGLKPSEILKKRGLWQ